MTVRIAPSILAGDFARLADAVARVEAGGADFVHVDVMDGHFVPNITIGIPVVKALKRVAHVPLDVHLMITNPDQYLEDFVRAGADMLTVHAEVLPHLHRTLTRIRELGARAGAAINPSTPVDSIRDVARELDHLLVMSVNPGFSGQVFIPHSVEKVAAARELLAPPAQPRGDRSRRRRGHDERGRSGRGRGLDSRRGRRRLWRRRSGGSDARAPPIGRSGRLTPPCPHRSPRCA